MFQFSNTTPAHVCDQLTIAASCRREGLYDQAREHIGIARIMLNRMKIRRGQDGSWVRVEGGTVGGKVLKTANAELYTAEIYDSSTGYKESTPFHSHADAQTYVDDYLYVVATCRSL